MTLIHPNALVDKEAEIGADVKIGPYTVIQKDVVIGDKCEIGPHVVIHPYTTLGGGCRIHAQAVIGDLPQDMDFKPGVRSYVKMGNRCTIREGVTIHRGTNEESETVVGDESFLMAYSHLAHNVQLGKQVVVANGALIAGYAEIGDQVFLSGHVAVHQFVRIGRLAMMGGGSMVSQDVPPFCTVEPMAVNEILGLNTVGLKRAGWGPDERKELKKAFTILFNSGLNFSQAVERAETEAAGEGARELCAFIKSSKRGVCTLRRRT